MYDPRTASLDPPQRIDRPDLVAGALAAMVSLMGAAMFVLLYLPLR